MERFWHYWKQGWKLQLIMLIFNVVAALLLVPLVLFFNYNETLYYLGAAVIYLVVLIPVGGKLMTLFPARS